MEQQEIDAIVAKAVDAALAGVKEQVDKDVGEKLDAALAPLAATAGNPLQAMFAAQQAPARIQSRSRAFDDVPGVKAARIVRAVAMCKMQGFPVTTGVPHVVEHIFGDAELAKQLTETGSPASEGGYLVPTVLSDEIIELLRERSVVMAAGPIVIDMPQGNLTIPAGATGSTAAYAAEAANIAATQPSFREVILSAKKLGAIVPISNELLTDASGNVDVWVRDDLVNGMAERMDLAFLRGDGTSNTPTGLLNLAQAGAKITANSTVNLANVTNDLGQLELVLLNHVVPLEGSVWFVAPRTLTYLKDLRDGNGNLAYPTISQDPPTLRGRRVFSTSQIPINLGAASPGEAESEIYLVNMRHVLVGRTGTMEVTTSQEASYYDGSALQSAFSRDLTLVRAIERHDIDIRQQWAVAILQEVTWA